VNKPPPAPLPLYSVSSSRATPTVSAYCSNINSATSYMITSVQKIHSK